MKKNLIIAIAATFLTAGTANSAQTQYENAVANQGQTTATQQKTTETKPVYEQNKVDVKAAFPGGEEELMKFLMTNIKYPQEALSKGVSGRVLIQFIVETDGTLTEAKAIKSLHPACDAEALRIIKEMPRWTPAKIKGKSVRSQTTLPFMFRFN